uniref:Uncharacterized protein n=1 Tax=Rhizochromulina marina TaxID=1034831 RepID=A0A7S2W0L7_9STRA|mmetsp:Transcript_1024/g.3330  ORF Transcript_1024/g.3330 Transcript_1024/m.3330 type:complete len:233 (+) Transcript_1024:55-753(+)
MAPLVPVLVASICAGVQLIALAANAFMSVPPSKIFPVQTQYFGRLTFLTVQSNLLMTAYSASLLLLCFHPDPEVGALLLRLFPLHFALGAFLTAAYYLLDHFNEDNVKKRQLWEKDYPFVHLAAHLEHGLALPAVLYLCFQFPTGPGTLPPLPSDQDVLVFVGGYVAFYMAQTHLNKALTGLWVYPIFDDVTRKAGALGRCAFLVVLTTIVVLLGFGGRKLLEMRISGEIAS